MGFLFFVACSGEKEIEEAAIAVETIVVKKEAISQWVTLTTKLDADETAMIIPKTPGIEVTKLTVGLGERVEVGDLLFELDKTIVRKEVEQRKIVYAQAQRNYEQQRKQALEPNAPQFTQMSSENASSQLEQARMAYVNSLEQLEKMMYFAPIKGIVSQLNIQLNAMVLNDQPAIMISNPAILKGRIQISQDLTSDLYVGQQIKVRVLEQEKPGEISAINPVVDPRSNLHVVEIIVSNEDEELTVGAISKIQIERIRREDTLVIPRRTVLTEGEKNYVFVVNGEMAQKKEITLGIMNEDKIEVLSGLVAEDRVIVKGQQYVQDDTFIRVVRSDDQ